MQTIYLAFATLGFNTAVWLVMRNEEGLTGGTYGISGIGRPELFGLSLEGSLAFYYLILAATILINWALVVGLLLKWNPERLVAAANWCGAFAASQQEYPRRLWFFRFYNG